MNFAPFATWADLLAYLRETDNAGPVFYRAPMDRQPVKVRVARVFKNGKVRIFPGPWADPFTADDGHLDRFFRPVSTEARCTVGTHDDGKFIRTAITVDADTSFDLVTPEGKFLARVNAFVGAGESYLIVDVIDVAQQFPKRIAIGFSRTDQTRLTVPEGGTLVSVDFHKVQS